MARRSAPRWVRWASWLLHNPVPVLALAAVASLVVVVGLVAAVAVVVVSAVGCGVWARRHRSSWDALGGRVLLGAWRSAWTYGVRWRASMIFVGLAGSLDGHEWVPRVVRVRAGRFVDRVTVRFVVGQQPDDWDRRSDALAHAFGARSCQVTMLAGRPGFVELAIGRADPLAQVVPALPVPEDDESLDLAAVPVGVTENGEPWRLDVTGGRHTLIAGVTGAGKGSVVWSLLRGLGPAVASGRVQVWCCDPKGGMELAPGAGMFTRFEHRTEAMVELLEDAAAAMQARCDRLRGVTRAHVATPAQPALVVVVDELAHLTAYGTDPTLRKRATQALSLLLSQGRAPAVTVVAALQDSRKDVVQFRDLFPTGSRCARSKPTRPGSCSAPAPMTAAPPAN
jgi:S-DNA-T family DNA segregation ATPase FtsK/SpoIIIE